jgi:putative PIN family toxin of toxin-antitoxin system
VLDANVITSALLTKRPESPPARIVQLARDGELTILASAELVEEYRDVLLRDHIRQRHGLIDEEVDILLVELTANARFVVPPDSPPEGPDPNDAHLWRLLRVDPLGILITGDRALTINSPPWATVMSPREWLDRFEH